MHRAIIVTAGGAGYKQPTILLATAFLSSQSRWGCCYQFLITWRKNKNCDQKYLTKTVKSGTSKQSDNILGKWIFYSKLIPDVQAVNTNTAELEAIWKLNLSLTLNWRLRRAITLVFAWRYKIQNSKYYGVQEYWRFTPKVKTLWKMKLFASHKHDLQCYSLNIKMAGSGRYHESIKMLVSSDCLSSESSNNYLLERNG